MLTVVNIPAPLSFVEDMEPFRIQTDAPCLFSLAVNGGKVILRETYSHGPGNLYVDIDVREVLRDVFESVLPWESARTTSLERHSLDILYMIGNASEFTGQFTVIPGSGDGKEPAAFLRSHWLTHQPQTKEVAYAQPEWLTLYYVGETGGGIVVRFYSSVSGKSKDVVLTDGLETGKCYCVDVSPQRIWPMDEGCRHGLYDIFVQDADGSRLTYMQRYILGEGCADDRIFVCLNSFGGWDTFRMSGSREYSPETDYDVVSGSDGLDCGYADTERTFIQRSGPLTENMQRWMMDLLESRRIYAWSDGVFKQMVITESSVNIISSDTVKSVEFSYMYSDGSGLSATERDMTELPALPIADPGDILLIRIVDAAGSPISTVELPSSGDIRRVVVDSKGKWSLK